MINWTQFELKLYSDTAKVVYPNVVTLSQIYSMICQRLVEDGIIQRTTGEIEEMVNSSVKIDPITHQSIANNSAVVRASIRSDGVPTESEHKNETPPTTKMKFNGLIESILEIIRTVGSHYVYRGVLVLLQAIDAFMLLIAILGFYFEYRLTY